MRSAGQNTIMRGLPFNSTFGLVAGSLGVANPLTRSLPGDSFAMVKQAPAPMGGFRHPAFERLSCLGPLGCGGSGGANGPGGADSPAGIPPAGSGRGSRIPMDIAKYVKMTEKPGGELSLMFSAIANKREGLEWMEMVRLGMVGDNRFEQLIARPLVKELIRLTSTVMAPEVDNFTSERRTPWGGKRIVEEMKRGLGNWPKGKVVGESWEISGHPKFPNKFKVRYAGKEFRVSLGVLAKMFSHNLFGANVQLNKRTEMPYLVKLLNSGGWGEFIPELSRLLSELDKHKDAKCWRKAVGVHGTLLEIAGRDYDRIHEDISALERLTIEPILNVSEKHPKSKAWRSKLGVVDLRDIMGMPAERASEALAKLAKLQEESGFKSFIWDIRWAVNLQHLHTQMLARNLSVQVHPTSDYKGLKEGEHSKTEAWVIVGTEEGAGIYLGLREGVTKEQFAHALVEGIDVTRYLNFVPVKTGEVYFIPAGTIHAIGAGVMLVEPQETSETTYRVYDYGRLDDKGNPRQLHVDQAMAVTDWAGPRGEKAVAAMRREPERISKERGVLVERLVDESLFRTDRITLDSGSEYHGDPKGIEGFTVLEGAVQVISERDGKLQGEFFKGQSFIMPAAAWSYAIRGSAERVVLIETRQFNG